MHTAENLLVYWQLKLVMKSVIKMLLTKASVYVLSRTKLHFHNAAACLHFPAMPRDSHYVIDATDNHSINRLQFLGILDSN